MPSVRLPSVRLPSVRLPSVRLLSLLAALTLTACIQNPIDEIADVQVDPRLIGFGVAPVGDVLTREVVVSSIGGAPLLISGVRIEGEGDFELAYRAEPGGPLLPGLSRDGVDHFAYPLRLPAGERLAFELTYHVGPVAPIDARLVLTTNAEAAPEVVVEIQAAQGPGAIDAAPQRLELGAVAIGEQVEATVDLINRGQSPVTIDELRVDGDPAFSAQIELDGALEPLDARLLEPLLPGATLAVRVRYTPRVEGPGYAELVAVSDDPARPELIVPLSAASQTPCLMAAPAAMEFRRIVVHETSARPVMLSSCGAPPVEITRIALEDADPAFEVPVLPALPTIVGPADMLGIEVQFTPTEERVYHGTLVIESTDPTTPRREIALIGQGLENECPQAVAADETLRVQPLDTVVLDGSPSVDREDPDGRPVAYEWVIIDRPAGSVSAPVESFYDPAQPANGGLDDDPRTPTAEFFVDLAGVYTAELRVRDALGLDSIACDTAAQVTIIAHDARPIRVELTWRTPGDDDETDEHGADLDLHLLNPLADSWFSEPYDCYYRNPVPDWGQLGNPADDPSLDVDDIDGAGPEVITLGHPENTDTLGAAYLVGVHSHSNDDPRTGGDFGSSFATVRVYIDGELRWDHAGGERELEAVEHFWDAAQIEWPSGEVSTRDRYYRQRP